MSSLVSHRQHLGQPSQPFSEVVFRLFHYLSFEGFHLSNTCALFPSGNSTIQMFAGLQAQARKSILFLVRLAVWTSSNKQGPCLCLHLCSLLQYRQKQDEEHGAKITGIYFSLFAQMKKSDNSLPAKILQTIKDKLNRV